jgi:hypothetical protein
MAVKITTVIKAGPGRLMFDHTKNVTNLSRKNISGAS